MDRSSLRRALWALPALPLLASAATGQAALFQTPGMPRQAPAGPTGQEPRTGASGQSDRFDAGFNPAFSFIVDTMLDHTGFSGGGANDGVDLNLRVLEFAGQAWVDPSAWAYFVGATDGESLAIEEAALHYKGLGGNNTLRAGRFFIDFGKQMQTHVHELRTIDRPLVLRAYLGEEVKGDGLQWDSWTAVGDSAVLRWSFGVFKGLLPEESEFPNLDSAGAEIERSVLDRKDVEDLNWTARVTGFSDIGESGVLQLGASARGLPDYTVDDTSNGLSRSGLTNTVVGLDVTYGAHDDSQQRRWTIGGEFLFNLGDNGVETIDPDVTPGTGDESLRVLDDDGMGYLAFVDYAWTRNDSAGIEVSSAELADTAGSDVHEVSAYYTRMLSEFHRLRFQATGFDNDGGSDSVRFAIQYTAFVGAHGHGVNW